MELTEIRIDLPTVKYAADDSRSNLLACYSLIFDDEFAVHSVKLIQGDNDPFLAMPSERKHDHCPTCNYKNNYLANYCNNCGTELKKNRHLTLPVNKKGQIKLYHDLVHPLTTDLRRYLLEECLQAYQREKAHPGSILPMARDEGRRVG